MLMYYNGLDDHKYEILLFVARKAEIFRQNQRLSGVLPRFNDVPIGLVDTCKLLLQAVQYFPIEEMIYYAVFAKMLLDEAKLTYSMIDLTFMLKEDEGKFYIEPFNPAPVDMLKSPERLELFPFVLRSLYHVEKFSLDQPLRQGYIDTIVNKILHNN